MRQVMPWGKVNVVAAKLINVYGATISVYLLRLFLQRTGTILVSARSSRLCNSDKESGVALLVLRLTPSVCGVRKYSIVGKRNLRPVWKRHIVTRVLL